MTEKAQQTMDQILADDEPRVEPIEQAPEAQVPVESAPTVVEDASVATSATEADPDDLSDLPEAIRTTLDRRPEDADNWRNLREIAKDSQAAAREAAKEAATVRAEKAKLEAEVAAYHAARQQAPAARPQPLPPVDEDPGAHIAALEQRFEARLLNMSEAAAIRAHGKEKVDQAFTWYQQQADPVLAAQVTADAEPYEFLVREHARRATLSQLGEDPAAAIERIRAEGYEQAKAEFAAQAAPDASAQVEAALAQRLPKPLGRAPGSGVTATRAYAGPTPMDQILERK